MFAVRLSRLVALASAVLVLAGRAGAQAPVPPIESPVTDFTNSLSYVEWSELQKMLGRFEDTSAVAGRVVIVAGTGPMKVDEYARRLFDTNRMDTLARGRSFLLLVVAGDNRAAIHVGTGITGVLSGPVCDRIVEEDVVRRLRSETVFSGVVAGLDAAMSAFNGRQPRVEPVSIAPTVALVLVLVVVGGYLLIVRPALHARRRQIVGPGGEQDDAGWGYRPPAKKSDGDSDRTSGPLSGSW